MTVRKAVFPAAGLGTRFLPATKAQPKEMLPLVDKPTIQYVVEEAVASGLEEIILVTGRNKRAIEDHFDAAFELEYYLQDRGKMEELAQIKTISELASVSYVRQKEPLGLGHAILCARPLVGDEPFGVFLGDDIIVSRVPCMRQLLHVFERHSGPVLAVMRVPHDEIGRYGVIAARGLATNVYEVLDLVEKPDPREAPSDLAIVGRYVLTPDLFPILADTAPDSRGEIQLTNGLRTLRGHRPIYAVEFEGKRNDMGEKLGSSRPPSSSRWRAPSWPTNFAPISRASTCSVAGNPTKGCRNETEQEGVVPGHSAEPGSVRRGRRVQDGQSTQSGQVECGGECHQAAISEEPSDRDPRPHAIERTTTTA